MPRKNTFDLVQEERHNTPMNQSMPIKGEKEIEDFDKILDKSMDPSRP